MKIRFFLFGGNNQMEGVFKKELAKITLLKKLGLDCEVTFFANQNKYIFNDAIKIIKIDENLNLIQRIRRARYIAHVIGNQIKNLDYPDCVLLRYPYYILYYPKNILKKKRRCKIVFEHNTKETDEFKLLTGCFSQIFLQEIFLGRFIRSQADAIVGVTDEITQYQLKRCHNPDKPHITIGNGIDVASVPLRHHPPLITTELHLLFVANVSRWHGIDRLIRGLASYDGKTGIILHVAGEGAELPNLKKLVKDYGLTENVIFHGFMTGQPLDELFNTCHIAVGSLGIHRKGLSQTSELKVREYCARGIPWIIACRDPDFPDDFPYVHRIPADESPVNCEEVLEFAKRVCKDPEHPQKMRDYTMDHLDWSIKMKKLKEFLEKLVGESPSDLL